MFEGGALNFYVEAFDVQCEQSPCVGPNLCSVSCGKCSRYFGAPYFSIKLVNSKTLTTLDNVTCKIGISHSGSYPVSCLATNSMANNHTFYKLILSITQNPTVPLQATESPATVVLLPGDLSVPSCTASWVDGNNSFQAGGEASLLVWMKDAYNNTLSLENGREDFTTGW